MLMALLQDGDSDARVRVLTELVLDLVVEVEALRSAFLLAARAKGVAAKQTTYGRAYRDATLLTHDASGVSGGMEKLLARWLGDRTENTLNGHRVRELAMLRRLGYSEDELKQYLEEAESHEART